MELNTEINKVFGKEIAKVFAAGISDEEIEAKAKEMWTELCSKTDSWGHRTDSVIEQYIKNVLLEKLHEKILKVLQEPVEDSYIENKARELIKKAKEVAEEAIVRSIANGITTNTLSVWNTHDKFVNDVLNVLRVNAEKDALHRY